MSDMGPPNSDIIGHGRDFSKVPIANSLHGCENLVTVPAGRAATLK